MNTRTDRLTMIRVAMAELQAKKTSAEEREQHKMNFSVLHSSCSSPRSKPRTAWEKSRSPSSGALLRQGTGISSPSRSSPRLGVNLNEVLGSPTCRNAAESSGTSVEATADLTGACLSLELEPKVRQQLQNDMLKSAPGYQDHERLPLDEETSPEAHAKRTKILWREDVERSVRRLMLDTALDYDENISPRDRDRLRCKHLENISTWCDDHGSKQLKREKYLSEGPNFIAFDDADRVMPGSTRSEYDTWAASRVRPEKDRKKWWPPELRQLHRARGVWAARCARADDYSVEARRPSTARRTLTQQDLDVSPSSREPSRHSIVASTPPVGSPNTKGRKQTPTSVQKA